MGAMAGQIAGSVIGGVMSNNAAKRQASAQDRASALQAQGYTDARPYVKGMYEGGQAGLDSALSAGYYSDPTYAGMNNMQNTAANNMFNFGNNAFGNAGNIMNATGNFGGNYANLYNQASADRAGIAENYVNANADPMVNRALRDSTRQLEEDTLTNIGMGASATGNTNSSRAGVAEAIAGRGYMDRAADTRAGIENRLRNESFKNQDAQFSNMMNANAGLSTSFNNAFGMGNTATGNMANAGSMFQTDDQNRMNDDRARFEGNRDFELDMYNKFNAGILGRAPRTAGNVTPNFVDPTTAAFGGAYAGFGMGNKITNAFQPQTQPMISGGSYNSSGYNKAQYYDPNSNMAAYNSGSVF